MDLCLDIYVISIVLFIIQLSYYCKHPSNALKEPRRSEEMRFHVFDFLPSAVVLVLSVAAGSSRASQSILVCLNVPACGLSLLKLVMKYFKVTIYSCSMIQR